MGQKENPNGEGDHRFWSIFPFTNRFSRYQVFLAHSQVFGLCFCVLTNGCGSKPTSGTFSGMGWLPSQGSLSISKAKMGCSPGYRGFDPLPNYCTCLYHTMVIATRRTGFTP